MAVGGRGGLRSHQIIAIGLCLCVSLALGLAFLWDSFVLGQAVYKQEKPINNK